MPDPQTIIDGTNARSHSWSGREEEARTSLWIRKSGNYCKIRRRLANLLASVLLLSLAFASIAGCGGGSLAFDGGHIPVGGGNRASLVSGTVFLAEDFTSPVPNAVVTVTNTSVAGVNRTQTMKTGKDGSFSFASVPDVPTVNQFQVSVAPPPGSNRAAQQMSFPVNGGATVSVLVAMPKITFDQTLPASVAITPSAFQLHSGDTVKITAQLLDAQGVQLPVSPSLVFTGGFGVIQPDGLFTSSTVGTGAISAYWYTGQALLQSNSATVTADTSTPYQPPPPPVVAPTTTKANK